MTSRIQREITQIKNLLLQMSSMVEEAVRTAIQSCQRLDTQLAQRVIERDWEIDYIEVQIDNLVLKTLALQQPMASDLRFLTSAMQIAGQLERVGDHAVNISEQVLALLKKADIMAVASPGLRDMAQMALKMLDNSINAFVQQDAEMAYNVRMGDKEVDELYTRVVADEIKEVENNCSEVRPGVYNIILALNIERIADLATNIAEDVIFLVEGKIIRHVDDEAVRLQHIDFTEHRPEGGPCSPPGSREPLECLHNHSKYVHKCLEQAVLAIQAYLNGDDEGFEEYSSNVVELEHAADMIKRNVRAHLPRGIIMPIDKFELFLFLNEQDAIADTAEDLLEWLTYRKTKVDEEIKEGIRTLLNKCLDISQDLPPILNAAATYFETGDEDTRSWIKERIRNLRVKEHEADIIEHRLRKKVFSLDNDPVNIFYLVQFVELVGKSADHAESAADILRSMIAK